MDIKILAFIRIIHTKDALLLAYFLYVSCSMKAHVSTVPKKVLRVSKKVLKAPKLILNMPKDILNMSWEMSLDLINASVDILGHPGKITEVPKQLLHMPVRVLNKVVKTFFTLNADFRDNSFLDQEAILIGLINKCKKTMFGKRYAFSEIKTIADFQNQVPIFHYHDFEPWVHYMLKWWEDITYPGKIDRFATSSWTTGTTAKYLPVTMEWLRKCHFKGSIDGLTFYIKNNPRSQFLNGKWLIIWGALSTNPYTGEENVWFISAILQKNTPWLGKILKEPQDDIAYIEDRENKLDAIVEYTVDKNITSINGQPWWLLNVLYRVLEYTGKKNISEVRPNLELFFRGWLPITLYKDQFEKLIPNPKMKYYQVYNASEWFFGIQDENDVDDMLLLTNHGTFYEFIALENYGTTNVPVLSLQEVELGKEYVIIITNCSGFWRYILGDVVVFTNLTPRKIKITGRTKYFIDMIGERMFLSHIEKAILETCKKTDTIIAEYTVWPHVYEWWREARGAHERIIEFIKKPEHMNIFTKTLDQELWTINPFYADERYSTKVLGFPIVHAAPTGTFYEWMKTKNKLGGQYKVPKVANDRKNIDEILGMINIS